MRDQVIRPPASLPQRLARRAACELQCAERLFERGLTSEVTCPGDPGNLSGRRDLTS
jgi:hypothetical protein